MPQSQDTPAPRVPIKQFATEMRRNPTTEEDSLWSQLLILFDPYKATIRAQEPIGPYVADFYISPCNVVVEVDGLYHLEPKQKKKDSKRDKFMRNKGIRVMRFRNDQVNRSAKACAQYILNQCLPLPPFCERTKVTYCPPVHELKWRSKQKRGLFWPS